MVLVEMMTAQDADVRRMVFNEFFSWRRKVTYR
jgi:hypothetical protein